ncbi:MAG TPA: SH3 domain-containing protein [Thermomicrobiales bacterium]|jgi:uncharacterized protein YraI|nr:SH3 domain-containing protein [Thermomicrobiales bacterium]
MSLLRVPMGPGISRPVKVLLTALIVAAMLLPLVSAPAPVRAASAYTTDYLNLRAGPSSSNYIKLVMPPGSSVDLVSDLGRSGYYKVSYQGELGYAHSDYLSVGGGSNAVDAGWDNAGSAFTTDYLNLRAGPSTGHDVVTVMPVGATVQLTGAAQSGFSGVVYGGMNGWASTDYLSSDEGGGGTDDPGSGNAGTAYTTSSLNLRTGPSLNRAVIMVMPSGAAVTLTGEARNGFAGVDYNGTTGWASQDYLTTDPAPADDGYYTGDEIVQIIYTAADTYGQSRSAMLAVAQCESLLDPYATNAWSGAAGLFQFLPGTWATTPWAGYDIYDPVANANAAAWMWSVGRRGEWVC